MLAEQIKYQQIYNMDNTVTIHRFKTVLDDGIEVATSLPHTKTIVPGDDYSQEDPDTQKICKALWTKALVTDYQTKHDIQDKS